MTRTARSRSRRWVLAAVSVMTPWGTTKARTGRLIRPIVQAAAERYGFSWVDTESLTLAQAPDGIHPKNDGSRFLRDQVLQNSALADRFPLYADLQEH